jgi:hypothetical protein
MIKTKNRQFTKRLLSILFLIHISYIMNKDKEKNDFFEVTDEEFYDKYEDRSYFEKVIPGEAWQSGDEFDENVYMGLFESQECLYDKTKSEKLFKEKGISYQINENNRFILGQCNPIVMVPGLYSTRLNIQIDCKKFKENKENLINMRLFCGESVCKNDYEEHVIWPALFDSPFTLRVTEDNKFSACFGYFFKFMNYKTECPEFKRPTEKEEMKFLSEEEEQKSESVCLYDDSVRITFYGGTDSTKNNSQCGIKSIKNIVSVGKYPIPESWVNSGAPTAFRSMHERFYQMGYRPGFSIAGVPFDFRRFISSNMDFKKILKYQVERLYNNTNKPVVIIGHSYGCLNVLEEMISDDAEFHAKIKKFVAIAPPFAGSSKAVDILLHGSKEFDTKISLKGYDILDIEFDEFSQRLVSPYSPAIYELKPNPVLFTLFKEKKYEKFSEAIIERIELEKECKEKDCDEKTIMDNSIKFNDLFKRKDINKPMFPSFLEEGCKLKRIQDMPKYNQRIEDFKKKTQRVPNFLPCRHDIYDIVNCPTIVVKTNEDETHDSIESRCIKQKVNKVEMASELFDASNTYFNYECEKDNRCLDSFIDQFSPYPYFDQKMVYLIDRFYKKYHEKFPDVSINSVDFFGSHDDFIAKVKSMINYHSKLSKTRNLDIPKVDTIVLYSSFLPTKTAYLFDTKKIQEQFSNIDVLSRGGDGTVSSWSSLLVGLKWIFDKYYTHEDKILQQNIQVIEYCSILSQFGKEYLFNKNAETPQEFSVLSCDCLDSDGLYKTAETSKNACDHSNMISDSKVIKFLEEISTDEKFVIDDQVIETLKRYNINLNYENQCNDDLLKFSKGEK